MRTGRPRRSDEDIREEAYQQLDTNFVVDSITDCWIFTGPLRSSSNIYGMLSHVPRNIEGVHGRVHVCAYLRWKGKVPAGRMVCHICNQPLCFNPAHLYAGTNSQNQLDAVADGAFERYWTAERRVQESIRQSGAGNPMYGRRGKLAPAFGRTGAKHPMFGKHHTKESRLKTSKSLLVTFAEKRNHQ